LSEDERLGAPLDLIAQHPALMKRPLIVEGDKMHLGWTKDVQAVLLG
jgi:arsenate reductase